MQNTKKEDYIYQTDWLFNLKVEWVRRPEEKQIKECTMCDGCGQVIHMDYDNMYCAQYKQCIMCRGTGKVDWWPPAKKEPPKISDEIWKEVQEFLSKKIRENLDKEIPVMKNGTIENFMPKIYGKSFRCNCGCNVFHKPDVRNQNVFQCNSCEERYMGE